VVSFQAEPTTVKITARSISTEAHDDALNGASGTAIMTRMTKPASE
jgi:hypothetical protein